MASRRDWFTASMVFAHDLNQLHRHHFGDDGSSHGEEGGGHGYAFEIEFHLSLSRSALKIDNHFFGFKFSIRH